MKDSLNKLATGNILCSFVMMVMSLLMLSSCAENDAESMAVNGKSNLSLNISMERWNVADQTRASYSAMSESSGNKVFSMSFTSGDAIGLFVCDKDGKVVATNRKWTYSGSAWTTDTPIEYVTGMGSSYTYFAYYPWVSSLSGAPALNSTPDVSSAESFFASAISAWTPAADQSTVDAFTGSDLMVAKGTATMPLFHEVQVDFTMTHQMGLAVTQPNLVYYDVNEPSYTWTVTQDFTENIPYQIGTYYYYLVKPGVETIIGAKSTTLAASQVEQLFFANNEPGRVEYEGEKKVIYLGSAKMLNTGTIEYSLSTDGGSTWSKWSKTNPSWLTIEKTVVDGYIQNFKITATNSTSTNIPLGTGSRRYVAGDATLKAAAPVSNVDLSMVDNAGNPRASRTTANCYLVHAPGTYKIPLVYGNAIKNGSTNALAYQSNTAANSNKRDNLVNHEDANITAPWITASGDGGTNGGMGYTVDGAAIVWQDVEDLISSVNISSDGYYITFTLDRAKIAEGNAVIAAKAGEDIVWSWHIWVTNQTLSDLTTIATGSHTYQVAPENVGQLNGQIMTGDVYAGEICDVRARKNNGIKVLWRVTAKDYVIGNTYYYPCPYFQWGKKDPEYSDIGGYDENNDYSITPTVVSVGNSIGATIKNPGKHFYNSGYGHGPYNEVKRNFWDINQTGIRNVTTATIKTVYDPCPPGFCVPTFNLYYFMTNNGSGRSDNSWTNGVKTWRTSKYSSSTTGSNLKFPGVNYRSSSTADFSSGIGGAYWSATAATNPYASFMQTSNSEWSASTVYEMSAGLYVRPVVEE